MCLVRFACKPELSVGAMHFCPEVIHPHRVTWFMWTVMDRASKSELETELNRKWNLHWIMRANNESLSAIRDQTRQTNQTTNKICYPLVFLLGFIPFISLRASKLKVIFSNEQKAKETKINWIISVRPVLPHRIYMENFQPTFNGAIYFRS